MGASMYGAGVEYALHSMLILASHPEPVSVSDLATYQGIPERFLAKLFTRLKHARLVKATEGITGGFLFLIKPLMLYVIAAVVLPVINFIVLVEITRGATSFLGDEIDVSNLTRLI